MGKEYYPLMGPWGGEELPSSRSRCAMSLDRYPAFLSFLTCPSVTEETIHLPPAPDMAGEGLRWGMRTWALELEYAKVDRRRRKKAWVKGRILIPLYGRTQ